MTNTNQSEGYVIKIGHRLFLADDLFNNEQDILPTTEHISEAHVFEPDAGGAELAWKNRDLIWDFQDMGHGLFGHEVAIQNLKQVVAEMSEAADNI